MVVLEAPRMDPIWLSGQDYDRIRDLSVRERISETEVVQRALKWYEDCLTVAEKIDAIDGGGRG